MKSNLIKRQDAIDIVSFECGKWKGLAKEITKQINALPSAQPEVETQMSLADDLATEPNAWLIGYGECASAMLKMWIDNVLTDGEYNRIMDKLNKHWQKGDVRNE